MSWMEKYRDKISTAENAVKKIKRGDYVFIGSGCACPQLLIEQMINYSDYLGDVKILHILTLGNAPYVEEKFTNVFRHNAFFIGANVREAIAKGRADYTPVHLSEIPLLLEKDLIHVDIALIQVSPPDLHGFCSYGISVDIVKTAAEKAGFVIAEVNPRMPRTLGDSFIHVNDIDCLVESSNPLPEMPVDKPDEVAMKIAKNVATLVEDNSTIQLGFGRIPNAIASALQEKHNLGVHTELFTDSIINLIESGVITGSEKKLHKGKVVASFCMGTQRLYELVNDNPLFEFHPAKYVNNPFIIGENERMVAINSALQIDLTGQVCADSLGYEFFSGIGGHTDFIRGATRSVRGKPIIALPSTTQDGSSSRIVPHLDEGAGVAVTRADIHYVATEFGIANLHGRSIRERAMALISLAHPKFREMLLNEAKEHYYVYQDQMVLPAGGAVYPLELETEYYTKDREKVFFRPVKAADEDLFQDFFYSLSDKTVYFRFFSHLKYMPHNFLQRFLNVDYYDRIAILGLKKKAGGEGEEMLAVGRYTREEGASFADVAFAIRDDYQGKGIGSFLLQYLIHIAKMHRIEGFTADVLPDNSNMMAVFQKSGHKLTVKNDYGSYHISFKFDTQSQQDPWEIQSQLI